MGRFFNTFPEAVEEIRRDLAKGTKLTFSRVQQRTGEHLPGRERTGYEYTVLTEIPEEVEDLVLFGQTHQFPLFQTEWDRVTMTEWLVMETTDRLSPMSYWPGSPPREMLHPALRTTLEGNWPAYLYRERLVGAIDMMVNTLRGSPDSRRAYWPIYHPDDAFRAMAPTRIPCSIGYQVMMRKVNDEVKLLMVYLQRSADFDTFWLTDVYLARRFQKEVARRLQVEAGSFSHYIVSFHSFLVEGTEIY